MIHLAIVLIHTCTMSCTFLPENFELLGELLSNLKWLLSTVEYGAANALLACYRDYRNQVPEGVSGQDGVYI